MVGAMKAPAASYSASSMPDETPAPDWTTTSAPTPLRRFTVSGVAATRASPGPRSRATAMRMHHVLACCRHSERDDHQDERDGAGGPGAGQQAMDRCAGSNGEHRDRGEPMPHHATNGQSDHDIDDVHRQHERQVKEAEVSAFMFGVVV